MSGENGEHGAEPAVSPAESARRARAHGLECRIAESLKSSFDALAEAHGMVASSSGRDVVVRGPRFKRPFVFRVGGLSDWLEPEAETTAGESDGFAMFTLQHALTDFETHVMEETTEPWPPRDLPDGGSVRDSSPYVSMAPCSIELGWGSAARPVLRLNPMTWPLGDPEDLSERPA